MMAQEDIVQGFRDEDNHEQNINTKGYSLVGNGNRWQDDRYSHSDLNLRRVSSVFQREVAVGLDGFWISAREQGLKHTSVRALAFTISLVWMSLNKNKQRTERAWISNNNKIRQQNKTTKWKKKKKKERKRKKKALGSNVRIRDAVRMTKG